MNKRKSKVLAFLLASSMLVPGANGIVSAAEVVENQETVLAESKDNDKVESLDSEKVEATTNNVASINGVGYETLSKAIKVAKEGDTVTLLADITENNWVRENQAKGITIDGAGHTIKIKNLSSSKNNAVFISGGESTFKNITIDLSESALFAKTTGIVVGDGDTIDKVNIKGRSFTKYGTNGINVGTNCKKLSIQNSKFETCNYTIWFDSGKYDENTQISIKNNEFDACTYVSILYAPGINFEGNVLKGGFLNIMNDKTEVKKNTFTTDELSNSPCRIKFFTTGNEETFKYNKVNNGRGSKPGVSVKFASADDTKGDAIDSSKVDLSKNFWGDKKPQFDKIFDDTENPVEVSNIEKIVGDYFKTEEELENTLNPKPVIPSIPSTPSVPSKPSKPTYTHEEIIGSDRYDTAAKIADKLGSYDNVVLVNATSTMSDGLSASGLAGKENGAILLTKKDSIPQATMDRIKRVKKVYIIGGEAAISQKVYDEITAAGIKVERLGGKDRVETSEIVAEKLGNYSDAFVVNGFKGEADAMSASSIAAKKGAPILLTNGKTSNHDKKSGVEYYVIGGNSVVDKSIVDKYNAEVLAGKDRYETNREVIAEFYSNSDKLYLANGDTLVDALTASPLAKNEGIVLINKKSDNSILKDKHTVQVGGMNFEIEFEK